MSSKAWPRRPLPSCLLLSKEHSFDAPASPCSCQLLFFFFFQTSNMCFLPHPQQSNSALVPPMVDEQGQEAGEDEVSKGCYSISCSTPLPNHLFPGCTTLSKVLQDRIDNGPHLSDGMQSPSMHHSTEQCQSFPSHKHTIHHTIHKKRVGILQAPSPSLSLLF